MQGGCRKGLSVFGQSQRSFPDHTSAFAAFGFFSLHSLLSRLLKQIRCLLAHAHDQQCPQSLEIASLANRKYETAF